MSEKEKAQKILKFLGNKENISKNTTCMTRLRVRVYDVSKVKIQKLKNIEGVLGVVNSDNSVHIVLGPGKVDKIGKEFSKLTEIGLGENLSNEKNDDIKKSIKENKKGNDNKNKKKIQLFFQKIANIFVPLLPAIIASGFLQGITNTLSIVSNGYFEKFWWYQLLRTISFISFTYLPIFVGINSVKEFGGTGILGGVVGALFVKNFNLPLNGEKVILPILNKGFEVGVGGLFAALLIGFFVAVVEKNMRKIVLNILSTFLTPIFTLIICGFFAIFVFGSLGDIMTKIIFLFLNFIYNKLGIFVGFFISASFLPLVSIGLHQALIPIHILLNDPNGATKGINYFLPIIIMAGGGQVGAGFAIFLKTKNLKLKKMIKSALTAGILGIGEPLMYGVTLPLGKPFIMACLGSGFGGVVAVLFHLGVVTQGLSGMLALLIVIPGTQLKFIIAMFCAYLGGFLLTYFWGIDEKKINELYS